MKKYILAIILIFMSSNVIAEDLMIFTADWCKACAQLKQLIDNDKSIEDKYNIIYVDYDANPDLVKQMKVRKIPTSFIFNKDGRIRSKNVGYDSIKYKQWINNN